MPPRFAYWTILAGGLPTAFRAVDREELLPTFHRLREKHPDAEMKWFARGTLWSSPEEARGARDMSRPSDRRGEPARPDAGPRAPRGSGRDGDARGRDWRPGGEHRDPKQKYADAKKARNVEHRKQRFERKHGAASSRPRDRFDAQAPPRNDAWPDRKRTEGGAGDRGGAGRDTRTPRTDWRAPKGDTRSPKTDWRAPKGEHRPPKTDWAAKGGGRAPKTEWRAPRGGSRAPKTEWRAPRGDSRAPKTEWRAPKGDSRAPKTEWRAPKGEDWRQPKREWRDRPPRDAKTDAAASPRGIAAKPEWRGPRGPNTANRGVDRRPDAPKRDWQDRPGRDTKGGVGAGHTRSFDQRPPKGGLRAEDRKPHQPREKPHGEAARRPFSRPGFERTPPPRPREPPVTPPDPPERGRTKRSRWP